MPRNKSDKKFLSLEPDFNDIFVSKEGKADPFVEIFVEEPQNIAQQTLGTIAGVFEINDNSEKSSYVVNYLISVIKKEYFSVTKRGAIESFEASLHKANLVLAKLAEHGTVEWLGKLNAVCAVIEKNNIHFSQTGTAAMFLLRAKALTDISEAEEHLEDPNPLKTFRDVVSGRLEDQDKLILTTDSIFTIFSPEELKKSALKFSQSEFIRFLKTALVNELERAAVLVVDIKEKELPKLAPAPKKAHKLNAFSQETFAKKSPSAEVEKEQAAVKDEERQEIIKGLKEEYEKTTGEFVDKKTGHIYIKEDFPEQKEGSSLSGIRDYGDKLIGRGGELFSSMKEKSRPRVIPIEDRELDIEMEKPQPRVTVREEEYREEPVSIWERSKPILRRIGIILLGAASGIKIATLKTLSFLRWKVIVPIILFSQRSASKIALKIKNAREKAKIAKENADSAHLERNDYVAMLPSREEKRSWFEKLSRKNQGIYDSPAKESIAFSSEEKSSPTFLPDFFKTKNIFSRLDRNQRIYLAAAIVLIFIVPFFIARFTMKASAPRVVEEKIPEPVALPLEQDKNVLKITSLETAYEGDSSLGAINVNNNFFAVGKETIVSLSDQKSYPIPDNFINSDLAFGMDDLNLIFLLKGENIISWSAASKKFQDNNISIPENAKLSAAYSFLTYAYLVDASANQIYRYPRAEGGFGAKTDWLKDTVDLSNSTGIAINENIFLADGGNVFKFFKNKKQDFNVEETATPIKSDKLYTKRDRPNLYIFDKENSRVVMLDQDGKIVKQYYNPDISSFDNFSIDETNKTAYLGNGSAVKKFQME